MERPILDPNTVFTTNAIFQDLKECVFYLSNTRISLFLDTVEAHSVSVNGNGGLLDFHNNKNLNITKLCCHNFTTTGTGLFFYIRITNLINASYLSFDSSESKRTTYGIDISTSNISYANVSRLTTYQSPGFYISGSNTMSKVNYYTIADTFSDYNQVTESTYGNQEWLNINCFNCCCQLSIFKDYSATTLLNNAIFAGNWHPQGNKPTVIWREGGTLTLENVIIQSNGTVQGPNKGFESVKNPKTIEMMLPDRLFCQAQLIDRYLCDQTLSNQFNSFLYAVSMSMIS